MLFNEGYNDQFVLINSWPSNFQKAQQENRSCTWVPRINYNPNKASVIVFLGKRSAGIQLNFKQGKSKGAHLTLSSQGFLGAKWKV